MALKVTATPSDSQPASGDHDAISRSAAADQRLALLRDAMLETQWTVDALAAYWDVDRGYVWKLVNGEKPWSVERELALPDDLVARFRAKQAEAFGLIVVTPCDSTDAMQQFVNGLCGLLSTRLPARASQMVKATMPARMAKAGTR